jgi:hypothetical protein
MQASGIFDIQSHTMTHTFYPVSDEIIDFHHPGDPYIWLLWNANPAAKPFYMTIGEEIATPLGTPIYRHDKAVVGRCVREDGTLAAFLVGYVTGHGRAAFFHRSDWREVLLQVAAQYKLSHAVAYERETESDYYRRLLYELEESKRIIENQLDKQVRILCWPNGGWTDVTHDLAIQAGYEATTVKGSPNVFNSPDPTRILRMGLHQVGKSALVSRLFVTYALNAHRGVWPYAPLRQTLARVGATPVLKNMLYRGAYRKG